MAEMDQSKRVLVVAIGLLITAGCSVKRTTIQPATTVTLNGKRCERPDTNVYTQEVKATLDAKNPMLARIINGTATVEQKATLLRQELAGTYDALVLTYQF